MERNEEDRKRKKQNIVLMILLAVMLVIGIVSRWRYVVQEVRESVEHYIPALSDTVGYDPDR